MGKRGPVKGSKPKSKPPVRKPFASQPIEKLPLWYQELVYEAATYNLNNRQLAMRLGKSPATVGKVLQSQNIREAIIAERRRANADREKQMTTIDSTAINRIEHYLKTSRDAGLIATLAVKHLKGRGIYVDNEKMEHTGKIEVVIEKELVDAPPEEKK